MTVQDYQNQVNNSFTVNLFIELPNHMDFTNISNLKNIKKTESVLKIKVVEGDEES